MAKAYQFEDMKRTSQICSGSGLDAGAENLKRVAAACPVCGKRVAIMYRNRLETHGLTRGDGGRKPKMVRGAVKNAGPS